jgi:hydroxyacylglutathione hydrolase
LIVEQIPAEIYTSNIYKITIDKYVWFVDIGNAKPAIQSLKAGECVIGTFITHSHYDHIHGVNELSLIFPNCKLYASEYAKQGLYSDKLNLSFYHENPIVYHGTNVEIIEDNCLIPLSKEYSIRCIYTPGHNAGSMCFILDNYLFTGDSYIPQIPVVTKLKSGDKIQNRFSLQRIKSLIYPDTIVCPGHQEMVVGSEINSSHFPDLVD